MQDFMKRDLSKKASVAVKAIEIAQSNRAHLKAPEIGKEMLAPLMDPVGWRQQKTVIKLQDVDNHLENPALDFRNAWLN